MQDEVVQIKELFSSLAHCPVLRGWARIPKARGLTDSLVVQQSTNIVLRQPGSNIDASWFVFLAQSVERWSHKHDPEGTLPGDPEVEGSIPSEGNIFSLLPSFFLSLFPLFFYFYFYFYFYFFRFPSHRPNEVR